LPAVVPPPLARVAALLRCPVCARPLAALPAALRCTQGHSYDVARRGHVTLPSPRGRPAAGDDAEMVAARAAVLDGGHFEPLTDGLARLATALEPAVVLDVGAGTGHHLAAVLDRLPDATGIALDASRAALHRASRAHPRIASVRADVWQHVPLADASVDLALSIFAPRHPAELARVLRPGSSLIVATPAPRHLRELAALHRVRIAPRKSERLHHQLAPLFVRPRVRRITWHRRVTRAEATALVRMGPAAHHLTAADERRIATLPDSLTVTAAVDIHVFQRPDRLRSRPGNRRHVAMPPSR
jgi:SAM-dependent methyltransferase